MIPGLSHLSYQHRLEALKLPPLQYRRYRGDMNEMLKISHAIMKKWLLMILLNLDKKTQGSLE